MVTMIKYTIPSEEAEQIHLGMARRLYQPGYGSTTKHYYYNIYIVDGDLDITTPLTREPISIICRDTNTAGRLLNDH